MRVFLVLALSSALTGSIFLTRSIVAQLNRHTGDRIVMRTQAGDSANTLTFTQQGKTFSGKKTK
jgi:hypothetical protein